MEFQDALDAFLAKLQQRIKDYFEGNFPELEVPQLKPVRTQKYIKVFQKAPNDTYGESIVCFIPLEDFSNKTLGYMVKGGIYKPASCSHPAKHTRGNIFSNENGMEAFDHRGYIKYLK